MAKKMYWADKSCTLSGIVYGEEIKPGLLGADRIKTLSASGQISFKTTKKQKTVDDEKS